MWLRGKRGRISECVGRRGMGEKGWQKGGKREIDSGRERIKVEGREEEEVKRTQERVRQNEAGEGRTNARIGRKENEIW